MRSGPATHPAANASLRVPGLITPSAETPGTMFPPGSWGRTCRSRARAFMKACTVFRWNKSHLKVTGELLGSTRGTSAIRSLLKMEWHEVYATINKLQSWGFCFFFFRCVRVCWRVVAFQPRQKPKETEDTADVEGARQIICCFISEGIELTEKDQRRGFMRSWHAHTLQNRLFL